MLRIGKATQCATRISMGARSKGSWVPLESAPEVMNKFLHGIGLPESWELVDVPSLDDGDGVLPPAAVAFVFLLPKNLVVEEDGGQQPPEEMFFMKETFDNASGPVALIHAVVNKLDEVELEEDSILSQFISGTQAMAPEDRGNALLENADILSALKAAQDHHQEGSDSNDSTSHRFVAIVSRGDMLVCLDGAREAGPCVHDAISDAGFPSDAAALCRKFVAADPDNHGFSAFALIKK
ncbi:unnamed protein product [Notodromas monacha]|uniref:Ubiquitin carboxyl-terminal hydrolase n=2 Tax=Notodromas monacha TaxID=399045 RepID=A0A7R9GJ99_9CRUS|nr:unnamed protein product [Notodromas monacha]CAG0923316.1 unnamed protein product [Notodromas monacha]